MLFMKSFFYSDFYKEVEGRYSTIQEGMYAYFEATRLLILAYSVIGYKDTLKKVLEPAKDIIKISYEKMKVMSGLVHDGNITNEYWYDNPKKLLGT
ncbi:hypothetical protein SRRS_07690 [Sporomusa rhizae]